MSKHTKKTLIETTKSVKKLLLASAFLIGTLPLAVNAQSYGTPEDLNLTGNSAVRWETSQIPVCWENPNSSNQDGRDWSRSAVENTWQKNSQVIFTGWDECQSDSKGIKILISDEGPHVKSLGKTLDGRENGMVLNFTFKTWSPSCSSSSRRENCIKGIAVHEFGHALGFAHEQQRADNPPECQDHQPGQTQVGSAEYITAYDKSSVMNYCNPKWNNNGLLSSKDVEGVQEWYGEPELVKNAYFINNGTVLYTEDGNNHCAFLKPTPYAEHLKKNTDYVELGNRNPSDFGQLTGECSINAYFIHNNIVFYSSTGTKHCAFLKPEPYAEHLRKNADYVELGYRNTSEFGQFTGECPL